MFVSPGFCRVERVCLREAQRGLGAVLNLQPM